MPGDGSEDKSCSAAVDSGAGYYSAAFFFEDDSGGAAAASAGATGATSFESNCSYNPGLTYLEAKQQGSVLGGCIGEDWLQWPSERWCHLRSSG